MATKRSSRSAAKPEPSPDAEIARREQREPGGGRPWLTWGPYLSERQWGTVREDYSPYGSAWDYFPHDHARSRAYRWGEDGLAGISDDQQRLCLALALWNERDPILKERLFGLTGPEGNHGEDVKEVYYYLDSTPTHSYMRMLYKYPQAEFPYAQLVEENRRRSKDESEFEIIDSGVFDGDRYFDVSVEYAKNAPDDILMRITVANRGPEDARIHVLPQLWYRNTWAWGRGDELPELEADDTSGADGSRSVVAEHPSLGTMHLFTEAGGELLFCENDTNTQRLYGTPMRGTAKDGVNDAVVAGRREAVNAAARGTKVAAHHVLTVPAGGEVVVRARLSRERYAEPFGGFDESVQLRRSESDAFYEAVHAPGMTGELRSVQRQAMAGMMWSKQFYCFDVPQWIDGDPAQPTPPASRRNGRNHEWAHLNNADVISMPDKWEYPWYAAWDLAFHCVALAMIDGTFAKDQLLLLTREWYMHPNGQLPAYEWAFGDVNPPVHAWATWRVYELEKKRTGKGDHDFLERIFHKLLLNFTWWVNRKDVEGRGVFQGGFLGLDNIGVFDRSAPLPTGGHIDQADGTSWMAMFSLNMMRIALELARVNKVYEDLATKFFEHFLYIAAALNNLGGEGQSLWDDEDEFFYDILHSAGGATRMKVRSLVGLTPLFAVEVLDSELLDELPDFRKRLEWFLDYRPDLAGLISRWSVAGKGESRLLSLVRAHRMKKVLRRMLDPEEFLSDFGVRALSRFHRDHPYEITVGGREFEVAYLPGESNTGLFGGNSNWRGPIWMPMNYLMVESLRRFHAYYGDDFLVECPAGSGELMSLASVADDLATRLVRIFLPDADGRRPVYQHCARMQTDPHFRDHVLFYEYFHGDSGRGVGASHQTGWTGVIADLVDEPGVVARVKAGK